MTNGAGVIVRGLSFFRGDKLVLPACLLLPLQLLLYQDRAAGEVHTAPCQPQDFALTHTREQRDSVQHLEIMAFDGRQKCLCVQLVQRVQLCAFHTGQRTGIRRIIADKSGGDGLL